MKVYLISGWYSSECQKNRLTYGNDLIRGPRFRSYWEHSVKKFINPDYSIVHDSNSPVGLKSDSHIIHHFKKNLGHSQNTQELLCGYTVAVIAGLIDTYSSDADVAIYVEQDALLHGNFNKVFADCFLRHWCVVGEGTKHTQIIQQSVFGIKRDNIPYFISGLLGLPYPDSKLPPELKFIYAGANRAQRLIYRMLFKIYVTTSGFSRKLCAYLIHKFYKTSKMYGAMLPVGYGRKRPIDFNDPCFYFQHGTLEEVNNWVELNEENFKNII